MTWDYWQAALKGQFGEIDPNTPQWGFYRMRRKNKQSGTVTMLPIAYYPIDGNATGCRIGEQDIDEHKAAEIWPFVARHPVAEDHWREVAEEGKNWRDIDATVAEQANGAGLGHNQPPTDPLTELQEQIDSAAAGADDYKEIATDDQLARAQTLRSRLLELKRAADKKRDEEKRPHIDAGNAIQRKWKPLIDKAEAVALRVLAAMNSYGTKKRDAAEDARRETERLQREAATKGKPAPAASVQPAAAPVVVKGAAGRAASGKMVKVVKSVTNLDQAFAYLKEQPEVRDAIKDAAQRLTDAGHTVPGVEVKEEMRYR